MKRIAFLTDIHLNEQFPIDNNVNPSKNLEVALADLTNQEISEIVFGGDIGDASAHNYFFDSLKQFSVKLILGNHDKFEKVREHFERDITKDELYYNLEDENYQYVFLDTSSDELSNNQLLWFQTKLDDSKELILFVHHPVLEIDTPVDKLSALKNREHLKSILINHKRNVTVFCGHYHMNDEKYYKNIKQFITQSLSFQVVKNATEIKVDNANFGYRIIEIRNDKIETHLINFNNNS